MSESLEPSLQSSPQLPAPARHWDLTILQMVVAGAIWDLCRVGKLEPWHALCALVLLAVPGATTLAARVVRGLPRKG